MTETTAGVAAPEAYSDAGLEARLGGLTMAQDSIQGISRWLVAHPAAAQQSVNIWKAEFDKCKVASKQLGFLYLANDVLQTCKKAAPAYRTEFARILPSAVSRFATSAPPELVAKAKRMVDVWKQRNVLPPNTLSAVAASFRASRPAPASTPAAPHVPKAFRPVLEAVSKLEASSARLSLAQDTMKALTSTLFPLPAVEGMDDAGRQGALLNLNAGLVAMAEYKKHLETDLMERSQLVHVMEEMAAAHKLALEQNAGKLSECLESIEKICATVQQLQQSATATAAPAAAAAPLATKEDALAAAAAAVAAIAAASGNAAAEQTGGALQKRAAEGEGPVAKRTRQQGNDGAVPPASAAEAQ